MCVSNLLLFVFQTRKRNFGISYLSRDRSGAELYQSLVSDWDLDVAFVSAAKPYLQLKMDIKPPEDSKNTSVSLKQLTKPKSVNKLASIDSDFVTNKLPRNLNLTLSYMVKSNVLRQEGTTECSVYLEGCLRRDGRETGKGDSKEKHLNCGSPQWLYRTY